MVMANLPTEMVDEILCRTPLTSTRAVRSSCQKWNTISKDVTFKKKHLAKSAAAAAREGEFLAIMMRNYNLYLKSVNLRGIYQGRDPSVEQREKLISLDDSEKVEISRVFHCGGLVLCTTKHYDRLVVWNPYSGETRWICVKPRSPDHRLVWYGHALGYDKSKPGLTHKVLRYAQPIKAEETLHEIYDLNSGSWRALDVSPDWMIAYYNYGVSLKGDTYWFAHDRRSRMIAPNFLICFDFTAECFGPRLPLPFETYMEDTVMLSSAREEQLAALFQPWDTFLVEVWVTTKIAHNAVSWSKLLEFDMERVGAVSLFSLSGSFLIDEERKAVVVCDKDNDPAFPTRETAHIIGEKGYYREVVLGHSEEVLGPREIALGIGDADTLLFACSYVPSTVQLA